MKALLTLSWTEAKLYVREPSAAFFTLAFPLLLFVIFGNIYGNEPVEAFDGRGFLDVFVPSLLGFIAATSAFLGVSSNLATYRDQGVLRRYHVAPVRPAVLSGAALIVYVGITAVSAIVLIAVAILLFDVTLPASPFAVVLATLLGTVSFMCLGLLLGSVAPTPRAAESIGLAIYFPMIFLSGAVGIPRDLMPDLMRNLTEALPLTHMVTLLQGLWNGDGWDLIAVAVLTGMAVVAGAASARTFRWE